MIWHLHQQESVFSTSLDGESDEGMAIGISSSGDYVVTGGSAGILRLWRLNLQPPSVQQVGEVIAHSKAITSLAFSSDDKQVVSAGEDGCIFLWWLYK